MDETSRTATIELQIRDYKKSDFEAMFRMDEVCFEPPFRFSRSAMRRFAQAGNAHVVIGEIAAQRIASQLAGFCIVHVNGAGNTTRGYVVTLDVAAEYRRKGIARELMRASETKACAAGCRAMLLHVFTGNAGAISFYEREGYAFLRIAPDFYGAGVDALVYRKPLV